MAARPPSHVCNSVTLRVPWACAEAGSVAVLVVMTFFNSPVRR